MAKNYTFLDLETFSAGREYGMTPREFIRLGQYAINDGPVTLTTDYDEILEVARSADFLITHNGISSDMLWLFGQGSTEALHMAMDRRVIDTWYVANLLFPAPQRFKMRSGRVAVETTKPVEHARSWLSLDNLCFQFDLPGKIGNLTDLAKKHNPPGTKRDDLEYGLIPVDDPDFLAYAEQDVVALRELFRYLMNQIKEQDYDREYIWREMALMAATCGQMQLNGILVNQEYALPRIEAQEKEKAETLKFLVDTYDFPTEGKSPWSSNLGKEATLKALADFGFTPENTPEWELTPKGAPKLGGEDLLKFAKDTEAEDFVTSLGRLKGMRSISQLVMDNIKEDGRVHPDVTSLQRSGRWCLPETHRLLTKRGILHVDEVREGDETLDMRNRWVKVKRIHRYESGEVHTYENKTTFIESTPEHRWVQWTENRSSRTVEPLFAQSSRRTLQLTPDSYPFLPKEAYIWSDMTDRERRAFLIGLLVTDGTAVKHPNRNTGRFGVYQTELKFYEELRKFLGNLVTSDYSRPVWKNPSNTIHEMRLDATKVQEILDLEELELDGHLRHSPQLIQWVLSLSYTESQAFLTAAYLADGNERSKSTIISSLNENIVPVFQIAAYRCGLRSNYRVYTNADTGKPQGRIALTRDRVSTRHLPEPKVSHQPVWCVETDTGTFTAWAPEGRWSTPYLTGNSFTKPGVTVFGERNERLKADKALFTAAPGKVLAGFDYSSADARAMAGLSGDHAYAQRFAEDENGEDLYDGHNLMGEAVFGADFYYGDGPRDKSARPVLRSATKPVTHGSNYGIGAYKLAKQINEACRKEGLDLFFWASAGKDENGKPRARPIPIPEKYEQYFRNDEYIGGPLPEGMFLAKNLLRGLEESYPFLTRFKREAYEFAKEHGFIINPWGRRMPVVKERAWNQAPAQFGQGVTREMMGDAILRLCERGEYYIRALRAIIHDELLMEFDEATIERDIAVVKECMEVDFDPKTRAGFKIKFPVGHGFGRTWKDASH